MINILLCDDEEIIHENLRKTLDSINCDYKIVGACYSTMEAVKFLRNPDNLLDVDVLILDYYYNGNGKNGIEVMPIIRQLCPSLPVLMLTTFDNADAKFTEARKQYKIDYIQKPVSSSDITFRLASVIDYMAEFDNLQKTLQEYNELLELYSKENEEIQKNIYMKSFEIANFIDKMNERLTSKISKDIKTLVAEVFNNLNFTSVAIMELLDNKVFDKRVYKVLKGLNNDEPLSNGVKKQLFSEWGIDKLFEYRYSKTGRIFVQELGNGLKPLVYCLDYNHKKHDG